MQRNVTIVRDSSSSNREKLFVCRVNFCCQNVIGNDPTYARQTFIDCFALLLSFHTTFVA